MDGNSTDNTEKIVNEFGQTDSRIKWFSEKDKGLYDAVNKGIKKSKGDWIYVLGSDDLIFESTTLSQIEKVLSNTNSLLVYGNVKINGDAGWAKDGEIYDGEFSLKKLLEKNICQQAVFYSKKLFALVGLFKYEYRICADWDMAFRSYSKTTIQYTNICIANFNGGGISSKRMDEKYHADYLRNLITYFGKNMIREEFFHLRFLIIELGNLSRKKGQWKFWWTCRKIYNGLEKLKER